MKGLAIREIADRTGIAAGTIRMWEQRYGFPRPERTPSGYRMYSEDDVETLRRVVALRGRGLSPLSRGRTGDIRIVVNVATPRRLSRTQKDLLERFAETITDDNTRSDEGMLAKLKRVTA